MSPRSRRKDPKSDEVDKLADYEFTVESVRHGYGYNAGRAGIFNPLYGDGWTGWSPKLAYAKLRRLWHWQLSRLRSRGWDKVLDNQDHTYACNCPPFGIRCRDVSRWCARVPICPFCYARSYLISTYYALEKVIFGTKKHPHEVDPDWRLVEFTATRSLSPANEVWDDNGKRLVLKKARHLVRTERRLEVDRLQPVAGFVLHRMEFFPGVWPLKRSGVLLCKAGSLQLRRPRHGTRRQKIHDKLTRKVLAQTLARTFAFPKTSFLVDVDDLKFYLQMFEGIRMFASYGKVRGGKPGREP